MTGCPLRNVLQLFRYGMSVAVANYEIGIVCIFKYLVVLVDRIGKLHQVNNEKYDFNI